MKVKIIKEGFGLPLDTVVEVTDANGKRMLERGIAEESSSKTTKRGRKLVKPTSTKKKDGGCKDCDDKKPCKECEEKAIAKAKELAEKNK